MSDCTCKTLEGFGVIQSGCVVHDAMAKWLHQSAEQSERAEKAEARVAELEGVLLDIEHDAVAAPTSFDDSAENIVEAVVATVERVLGEPKVRTYLPRMPGTPAVRSARSVGTAHEVVIGVDSDGNDVTEMAAVAREPTPALVELMGRRCTSEPTVSTGQEKTNETVLSGRDVESQKEGVDGAARGAGRAGALVVQPGDRGAVQDEGGGGAVEEGVAVTSVVNVSRSSDAPTEHGIKLTCGCEQCVSIRKDMADAGRYRALRSDKAPTAPTAPTAPNGEHYKQLWVDSCRAVVELCLLAGAKRSDMPDLWTLEILIKDLKSDLRRLSEQAERVAHAWEEDPTSLATENAINELKVRTPRLETASHLHGCTAPVRCGECNACRKAEGR